MKPPRHHQPKRRHRRDLACADLGVLVRSSSPGVRAGLLASCEEEEAAAVAASWSARTLERGRAAWEAAGRDAASAPVRRWGRVPVAWLGADHALSRAEILIVAYLEARGGASRPLRIPLRWIADDLELSICAASRALRRLAARGFVVRLQPPRARRGWRRARTLLRLPAPTPAPAARDRNAQPSYQDPPYGGDKAKGLSFPHAVEKLVWAWPEGARGELGAVSTLWARAVDRLGAEEALRRADHYRAWARRLLPLPVFLGSAIYAWRVRGSREWRERYAGGVGIYGERRQVEGVAVTLPERPVAASRRPPAPLEVPGPTQDAPGLFLGLLGRPARPRSTGRVDAVAAHRAALDKIEQQRRILAAMGVA